MYIVIRTYTHSNMIPFRKSASLLEQSVIYDSIVADKQHSMNHERAR